MSISLNVPKWRVATLSLAVGMAFNGAAYGAGPILPAGAQVAAGSAQIGTVGNTMTVVNSPNAIINWQSFSIGQSETVKFLQQSASSAVLNRVVGGQMSEIMGRLTSNGQVFLINPAGILVGAGAVIDTASFFASTLQMLDQDFLSGKLKFQGDAGSGKITNQGLITVGYGGHAVLMAPRVENSGIIKAPGGQILLAAGQKITLTSLDLGGLSFEVQAPTDSALNLGQLIADGGVVKVFAGSLKHSGNISATSLTRDAAGEIVLKARGDVELTAGSSTVANGRTGGSIRIESESGTARVAGNVSATGSSGAGGGVDVLGEKVVLTGNATLDASGTSVGGVIRVGGDWQGGNPDVKNAQNTFVGSGVTLKADATDSGDGGKIVVWADGDTRFLGNLSAQGGPNGGNGGNAEVSGKGDLLFVGGANLGAPKGTAGNLLLDPLDLFVDTVGGLNPSIIDETTDFPNHAVTVSPATLAAITGNVTLYASRDMRLNSAVTLTGAGQGLAASAGRDLQIGAGITTNGGAVSLTAARNMTAFGASPIATAGGNVSLAAQSLSVGNITVAAGAGTVGAASSAGVLSLGTISSAGGVNLAATGGSLSASNITTTGAVTLAATGGNLSTSNITATGAVNLAGSGSVSAGNVVTGGGAMTANSTGSNVSISSIDTRVGGGPTGATVNLISTPSSISTGNVQAGNANVTMSGTGVSTSTITTTGNVALAASAGSVSSTIDNAANVTATSNRSFSSTSINLSSNTVLNATSVIATASTCSSTSSCPAATVTLSGNQGVNVGTVTASAPATTNRAVPFNSINETVTINGQNGPILAMSPASQITATNVTLSTTRTDFGGAGGGIGNATTPLKVNNARNFTFRPNGEFNVLLNGSGPNQLDVQLGVAATGQTYSGTLSKPGAITLNASATDTTVTVANFAVTGGFDDLVFNSSPSISLSVPNGSLVATSIAVPAGDQVGRNQPTFPFSNVIQGLPVSVTASQDLTIASYTRAAGSQVKTSNFTASNGALSLGNVNAGRDSVSASGSTGVSVASLTSIGTVNVSSANGGITVDSLSSTGSNVTLTANNGIVGATNDGPGVEVTAAGSVSISANQIGATGYTNPLDLAANSVLLTATSGFGTRIGSDATASNPVTAATTSLTIDTSGVFNVDTLGADLTNLTVTASPSGVGAGGTAQVTSNGTTYGFASDGTNFSLANWTAPASQFAGGTLRFTSTAGDLTLNNIDFSASSGSLNVTTQQSGSGTITQTGSFDLGSGFLTMRADGVVTLANPTMGGLSAGNANSDFGTGCGVGGYSFCGVASFTAGNITDPSGFGSFSVSSRGAINTGNLDVGSVNFTAYSGGINTGTIGSAARPANSVNLETALYYGFGGSVQTGAIESYSTTIYADNNITIGTLGSPAAINAANPGAGSVYLYSYPGGNVTVGNIDANSVQIDVNGAGTITTGNINANAATTFPSSINLYSYTAVTTGTLDADQITISSNCCGIRPSISVGAIGSNLPGNSVNLYGSGITIGGALTLDAGGSGQSLRIDAGSDLTVNGNVTTGLGGSQGSTMLLSAGGILNINGGNGLISGADGSFLELHAGNSNTASPLSFASINAGATGYVKVDSPAGILQNSAAPGSGITAATVVLNATASGSAIERVGATPLDVYSATDLTLNVGGSLNLDLHGSVLGSANITKSDNAALFTLNNSLGGGQSLTIADNAGTAIDTTLVSPAGAINYTLNNTAGGVNSLGLDTNGGNLQITANGAFNNSTTTTNGGSVQITTNGLSGTINTGAIDSSSASGGGSINLTTNGGASDIVQTGNLTTGTGGGLASLLVNTDGSITRSGNYTITSDSQVLAQTANGDIGSIAAPLQITSPVATLRGNFTGAPTVGNVHAQLTGTSNLTLTADNDFLVASDTSLSSLALTTRGTGTGGTLSLTAPGQSFAFSRPGVDPLDGALVLTNMFRVINANGATALTSASFTASDGNLLVAGGNPFNVSGNLDLRATNGDLRLEGTIGSPLVISSASQTLFGQRLFVGHDTASLGKVTLTAGGTQTLQSAGDLLVDARGGSIVIAGGAQTLQSTGGTGATITLRGGPGAGESVVVSGSSSQLIAADGTNGNVLLQAGTGTGSDVDVSASGAGQQQVRARGSVTLAGGAGPGTDSRVRLAKSGSGDQIVRANGNGLGAGAPAVLFQGGAADNNHVLVENTGTGVQRIGDSYQFTDYGNTPRVTLQGGSGLGAYVLVQSSGEQQVLSTTAINVLGGSGDGAYARINGTQTGNGGRNQVIGHPGIAYYFSFPSSPYSFDYYNATPSSITVSAGTGLNAFAEVSATGQQSMYSTGSLALSGSAANGAYAKVTGAGEFIRSGGLLSLTAGAGNGANASIVSTGSATQFMQSGSMTMTGAGTAGANTATARISSGGAQDLRLGTTVMSAGIGPNSVVSIDAVSSQSLSFGNLTLTAGGGDGSSASITAGTSQNLSASTTQLNGGGGQNALARIEANTSQSLSFGSLTLSGGTNQGATASIVADTGQSISASTVLVSGGTGTAAGDAMASIINTSGSQSLNTGSLTVRSGADYGRALIANQGSGQNISAGAITVTTSAGANNGGTTVSSIELQGSGTQTITSNSINVNNQHASSRVGIYAPGDQTIGSSGVVTVQVTGGSGTAEIVAAAGTQTVRGNSASTADAGQAASGGSANGGVRVQVTGGSGGNARIAASAGTQTILGQFVDINTSAAGTAAITATGNQWVRTTNGGASGVGSLRVAAIGGGSATLSSGGDQLLQIDYPELMQTGRDGRITVGNAAATGTSRIVAVNQDVFARSISVLGGATAGANAKIDVSGIQNVSLVSSSATPNAGISVTGGAGGTALIDPVTQTILANGTINVTGGTGPGTVAGIVGTGDQTILVTSGGAGSIAVAGGTGNNAFGQVITSGDVQRIGTSGGFTLAGGTGTNADAIIGANGGTAETFLACGASFTCNAGSAPFTAIPSVNNPFVNGATDVGVYYSPITVPLGSIIAATGGAPSVQDSAFTAPFDSSVLTYSYLRDFLPGDDEDREVRLGRLLPVCR